MAGHKDVSRYNDFNSSDSLLRWVCAPIEEGLVGRAALGAVALVSSLPVVEIHVDIGSSSRHSAGAHDLKFFAIN